MSFAVQAVLSTQGCDEIEGAGEQETLFDMTASTHASLKPEVLCLQMKEAVFTGNCFIEGRISMGHRASRALGFG